MQLLQQQRCSLCAWKWFVRFCRKVPLDSKEETR